MDSEEMISPDHAELEQLLSDIADEGATTERISRLDNLLLDRPDLQKYYLRATELNFLLSYELNLSLQPLLIESTRSLIEQGNSEEASESTNRGQARLMHKGLVQSSSLPGNSRPQLQKARGFLADYGWQTLAICASIAVVAMSLAWLPWEDRNLQVRQIENQKSVEVSAKSTTEPSVQADGTLVVRDARSLRTLDRMTRTSSLVSLELPSQSSPIPGNAILCGGSAWMERPPGQREHGYVVGLQPGYSLDLFIDTEAYGQNALGVVELDQQGRMSGTTLAFNNLLEGDGNIASRRSGCIGEYSDTNAGREPKFFLFAGSHLAVNTDGEASWRQSDCKVRYHADDLMVIGWDDSPYGSAGESLDPDRDYNDVRAILRFSKRHGADTTKPQGIYYSPPATTDKSLSDNGFSGTDDLQNYQFDVRPGEKLMLLISSSASLQNSVRIVESPTNEVIWQSDGVPTELSSEPLSDRGVYVIHNCGETVKRYQLQGRFRQDDGEDSWQRAPHRVLDEKLGSTTVGFEDSIDETRKVDWNDIRVHLRWFVE